MPIVQTLIFLILVLLQSHYVTAHGRLVDPASRSSMWRFGFPNPINYNDNQIYCGGFSALWEKFHGKCGVCGDRLDGPRENEAGGKYANGIIAARYTEGDLINVTVQLTTNHLGGYFEFNLCPVNDPKKRADEDCMLNNPVMTLDGKRRYTLETSISGLFHMTLRLPQGVYCTQCVFRWKYNAATSWGCEGGKCCRGCGKQEQFYACADVSISRRNAFNWKTTTAPSRNTECEAKLPWRNNPGATPWCKRRCSQNRCPHKYCEAACRLLVPQGYGSSSHLYSSQNRDQFLKALLRASNSKDYANGLNKTMETAK
ncbi:uncharacterized protein LOC115222289 [Octopus sinensis]|uniref:Uncharacterized protein LOC115222289 n=1 Tax=Octopus sinensis TaxID=2607531 RepID=A0A6P7TBB5_9MOLL|nr:uncharacterized protein LOC115222289 [Octopus sinensis]